MKGNEVRIGNLFTNENGDKILEVCTITRNGFTCTGIKRHEFVNNIGSPKRIDLHEDWLIKFGIKRCEIYFGNNESLQLDWTGEHYNIWHRQYDDDQHVVIFGNIIMQIEIKYVDQLQNLYYALTGEELKLEENEK